MFDKSSTASAEINGSIYLDSYCESDSEDVSTASDSDNLLAVPEKDRKKIEAARQQKEASNLWKLSAVVLLVLNGSCAGIAYLWSLIKSDNVVQEGFKNYAATVSEWATHRAWTLSEELNEIAVHTESLSIEDGDPWPFQAIPYFEALVGDLVGRSFIYHVGMAPVVIDAQRQQWENYTMHATNTNLDSERSLHKVEPVDSASGYYLPLWQDSARTEYTDLLTDDLLASDPNMASAFELARSSRIPVIVEPTRESNPNATIIVMLPLYNDFTMLREVVGVMFAEVSWDYFFMNSAFSRTKKGIRIVIENKCGRTFTYVTEQDRVTLVQEGSDYEDVYSYMEQYYKFNPFNAPEGHPCEIFLHVYPSKKYYMENQDYTPAIFAAFLVFVFLFNCAILRLYSFWAQKRELVVRKLAMQSDIVLSKLFPKTVRDHLMLDFGTSHNDKFEGDSIPLIPVGPREELASYLGDGQEGQDGNESSRPDKPIATLFPETTVMYADIAGFTAWSSAREPAQVFTLLETLYRNFDSIARRRRVFKVETIGDCYVSVTGLPDPQDDHALIMCRFARDCLAKMQDLTKSLEVTLGPDTAELALRLGMHSGPVTAGVLRGKKSHFQLFGETVNIAARMENTSVRDKIHLSEETAELLKESGKEGWIMKRPRSPELEAKNVIKQTYWLLTKRRDNSDKATEDDDEDDQEQRSAHLDDSTYWKNPSNRGLTESIRKVQKKQNDKVDRLVSWNVAIILPQLKKIAAFRKDIKPRLDQLHRLEDEILQDSDPFGELADIIYLPSFENNARGKLEDVEKITLSQEVEKQLRDYIKAVAKTYHGNSFHNYEHASHVIMSVNKLLNRIVAPEIDKDTTKDRQNLKHILHDRTYGITSDPLTHFAVLFAALIHDVDHRGVGNPQLINEQEELAERYKNKSVAEQNSVDRAWCLLMEDRFEDLRYCIYSNEDELKRFRALIVNAVMATDVFDRELGEFRRNRWAKAFAEDAVDDFTESGINRKATIVIEHLIQASDVVHTMQHWAIYRKWNERLFREMYAAFRMQRSQKDPTDMWYNGELWFFDNYVIPLAKKLAECGVFGVSSDELLNYALENRKEWEMKGEGIVAEMRIKIDEEIEKGMEASWHQSMMYSSKSQHSKGSSRSKVSNQAFS